MRRCGVALLLAMALAPGDLAAAREPFDDEGDIAPPVAPPDPGAFVVPPGLYYVTDTYVSDTTTTVDATTIYATTTVHESTGTYARVIDTIDTGASSAFDGLAFNGRGALTDGRALAGTYYENFVLTATGYVPVSIVFFQDDSETRRRVPPPTATPDVVSSGGTSSATSGATSGLPGHADPTSPPASRPVASPPPGRTRAPVRPTVRAGVALAADGPTLASAEVLRGRLLELWPRIFVDEVAVPVRSWRLVSPPPDLISASAGSVEPLAAQWIRMPAPETRWSLRFELSTDAVPFELFEARINVTLRSPALID